MTQIKLAPFGSNFLDSDRYFDAFSKERANSIPAVNIIENDKDFIIELEAPGLNKKDFTISLEGGMLTISAEKEEKKNRHYTQQEFNYSSFSRSFMLPEAIKREDIKAKYEDGILQIHLAKKEEAKLKSTKQILVS